MNRTETIELAENAKKILDNPAWGVLTRAMQTALQLNWAECKDPLVRDFLWHKQNALGDLIGEIETALLSGELLVETPEEG